MYFCLLKLRRHEKTKKLLAGEEMFKTYVLAYVWLTDLIK